MIKHPFISKEEEKIGVVFSEVLVGVISLPDNFSKKLDTVFFSKELDNPNYKEIIYKASIPLYLSLENVKDDTYYVICYFKPQDYDKVKIFLNSIKKNQKNANNNDSRSQVKN